MATCERCGKGPVSGYNVSHSKRHTKRTWKPNIQRVTLHIDGRATRADLCTRCLRSQHKMPRF